MSMSEDDLGLIAAGYSAILGVQVVTPKAAEQLKLAGRMESLSLSASGTLSTGLPKLSTHELFSVTTHLHSSLILPRSSMVEFESSTAAEADDDVFDVIVKIINGESTTIQARKGQTFKEIKKAIQTKLGMSSLVLGAFGVPLHDSQTISMLAAPPKPPHGIKPRIYCVGGGDGPYELDCSDLDPPFNYDLTNVKDDGKEYIRAGKVYKRPYGWKRFAVKVLKRYDNDKWLGVDGVRTDSSPGEWPVSYHGTNHEVVNKIIEYGYKIGGGDLYGSGVYTSPSLPFCEKEYSVRFEYKGDYWKVALQNRVNPDEPDHLDIIPANKNWSKYADFWRSPLQDPKKKIYDVRPYGILFKKVD